VDADKGASPRFQPLTIQGVENFDPACSDRQGSPGFSSPRQTFLQDYVFPGVAKSHLVCRAGVGTFQEDLRGAKKLGILSTQSAFSMGDDLTMALRFRRKFG